VVAGPTAVGKTAVSINLAQSLYTEIVSADSRQIYRELTIGTAKPSPEELAEVRHHFIDSVSISEDYNAARYGEEALMEIQNLFKNHNHVVLCGGSGLYIKAVCEGFDEIPTIDEDIRLSLRVEYEKQGITWLQDRMRELDSEYFEVVDQQNPQRLMRGLEVKMGTGISILKFQQKKKRTHDFNIIKIGLELERKELYARIDNRMDAMIDRGLFQEAQLLHRFRGHNALQTVGYQEIFDYIEGNYDRDETIRLLKRNSRRYAKRQLTWFKRDPEFAWFSPFNIQDILNYISSRVS
jgi:tRNA dimethylallyltransferase